MTGNELRTAVCKIAEGWVGRKEADGSHRLIIDYYDKYMRPGDYVMTYNDPWCATFTSAVGMKAVNDNGLACKPYELIPSSAACDPKTAQYQRLNRWVEDDTFLPQLGDEVFYDWQDDGVGDNHGSTDHVGLVVGVFGGIITVIEGNKSDAVGYRYLQHNGRYIRGYGRPDYDRWAATAGGSAGEGQGVIIVDPPAGEDTNVPTKPATDMDVGGNINLPMLQRGSTGEVVRAAQILLIGRGYRCGPCGADGDFGPATYGATYRFQHSRGLEQDGVIGPQTWAKLLGR